MDKLYLVKKVSKKEGKEPFTYVQLIVDLGYEKQVLTMDKDIIACVLDCKVSELYSHAENEFVEVGTIKLTKEVK